MNKTSTKYLLDLFPLASQKVGPQLRVHTRNAQVNNVQQLLFAEELLDGMDAGLVFKEGYAELYQKAEAYVLANPALLTTPWLRSAGAVHDIIEAIKQQRMSATSVGQVVTQGNNLTAH